MLKKFIKYITKDSDLSRTNNNIAAFTTQLEENRLLDGVILNNITITSTSTQITNKLTRNIEGWVIINKNSNQDVWLVSSTASFLTFQSTGTVTVSIYLF